MPRATLFLTSGFDNARTHANVNEAILNVSNVNVINLEKCTPSQWMGPCMLSRYTCPTYWFRAREHTTSLYVATLNDKVYAFDAATNALLWTRDFTNLSAGITSISYYKYRENEHPGYCRYCRCEKSRTG
jgi:hypothetical protein